MISAVISIITHTEIIYVSIDITTNRQYTPNTLNNLTYYTESIKFMQILILNISLATVD